MVMYTIVPLEIVFGDDEERPAKSRLTLDVGGVKLEVEQSASNEYEIIRLISSNPSDYLNEKYQPGRKIAMYPLIGFGETPY